MTQSFSGTGSSDDEATRIQKVYAEREQRISGTDKADEANPGNQCLMGECRARLTQLLQKRFGKPLSKCRILDVGCGRGGLLGWFHEHGTPDENLFGVDLLPNRIADARERCPGISFSVANAERLDLADASFDLVAAFTVFSSILDPIAASNLARNIRRVLVPGGAVIWYDMRYSNPWNPHLARMTRPRIHGLFPDLAQELESISLLPPLARRLGSLTEQLYPALSSIPMLRTHYLGLLRTT